MNFYEVLGIVGGIFELLEIIVGTLVGFISYFAIKREVNSTLRHADSKFASLQKALDKLQAKSGAEGVCS